MSNSPGEAKPVLNGFSGMDMRPGAQTTIADGWNVDYENGRVRRRKGRQKIFNFSTAQHIPSSMVWYNGTTVSNVTAVLADDLISTFVSLPFANANSALYVGLPYKFDGIAITLAGFNAAASTMTVAAHQGTSMAGSLTAFTIVDGTSSGGVTLAQNGNVTWDSNQFAWEVGMPSSEYSIGSLGTANLQIFDPNLYWIKFYINILAPGAIVIAGIRALSTGSGAYSKNSGMSALVEFNTRNNEKILVGVADYPNRYVDAAQVLSPEVRAYRFDIGRSVVVPVQIPVAIRQMTSFGQKGSFQNFNGYLVGATSAGYLWTFDGTTADELRAYPGNDFKNGVIGARAYLSSTPRGTQLETYHSRLMVTGDPTAPLTFYGSMYDNDIITLPPEANVGGPNVWPIDGVYTVPGNVGDFIQTAAVVNDRYVILTRGQIWVFDETSIRKVNGDIGCVSAATAQTVDQSIFFLSDNGVFVTDGASSTCISDPIKPFIDRYVNFTAAQFCACSGHNKADSEYWLFVPVNGESVSSVALVYNYNLKSWRIVGNWYVFGDNIMKASRGSTIGYNVTAACTTVSSDGQTILVTSDDNGNLFNENLGWDDDGAVYPAYAVMRELSSSEDFSSFREWYLNAKTDGTWIECAALIDDEPYEQEISRRLNNLTTKSEFVQKKAVLDSAVDASVSGTMGGTSSWGDATHAAKLKKIKFSFGRNMTKMRPLLHYPGGQFSAGTYTTAANAEEGMVEEIQFGIRSKGQGR